MVNYDIPWNPARLEQRMGRIHRYGQKRDPVVIVNLVAGATREGRVMQTLLEKLETIRRQLGSDKVFDVIGRLFQGVSMRDYLARAAAGKEQEAIRHIEGSLTREQVEALQERERSLYGEAGAKSATRCPSCGGRLRRSTTGISSPGMYAVLSRGPRRCSTCALKETRRTNLRLCPPGRAPSIPCSQRSNPIPTAFATA